MIRRSVTRTVLLALIIAGTHGVRGQGNQGGPKPEIRQHVDALLQAFNSGSFGEWQKMTKEHFTAAYVAQRSERERSESYTRLRAELGNISITKVLRDAPDAPLQVFVNGTTGEKAVFELDLEPKVPFLVQGLEVKVRIGGDDDERRSSNLPPIPFHGNISDASVRLQLDNYFKKLATEDLFSGVVLVAKGSQQVFFRAYGYANRTDRMENTTSTRFNVGSIDKEFTKLAVEQLVARGKLAMDDTIGKLLPDYPQQQSRSATVAQLLNHTAGIADFFNDEFDRSAKDRFRSNADYYRLVSSTPPAFAPGGRFHYCNGCYVVLGQIIEKVSGYPYEEYVHENVFKPSGMEASGWFQLDDILPALAVGYTRRGANAGLRSNIYFHGASGSAAGGGYASASDLLAFTLALKEGKIPDAKPESGLGIAGGAPGISASIEESGPWTTIVLSNLDPPTAETLARDLLQTFLQ